jgi:NAD(P)-dependent dehydrogenase (short-subunit alcohol dehydrogenase family)
VLHNARVIMINRKEEQGQAAIDKIKEEAGEDAKIEWLPCDLGNLREVQEVFSGIRKREQRLDLVRFSLQFLHHYTGHDIIDDAVGLTIFNTHGS